jgi:hypothetical protein
VLLALRSLYESSDVTKLLLGKFGASQFGGFGVSYDCGLGGNQTQSSFGTLVGGIDLQLLSNLVSGILGSLGVAAADVVQALVGLAVSGGIGVLTPGLDTIVLLTGIERIGQFGNLHGATTITIHGLETQSTFGILLPPPHIGDSYLEITIFRRRR